MTHDCSAEVGLSVAITIAVLALVFFCIASTAYFRVLLLVGGR